jgi:putative tricarboxylic transport membrane protein
VLGKDGVAGLVCLGGSLWLLAATRGLPHPALVPVGPAFYPRILLTVMALLSAALVVSDLVRRRAAARPLPVRYGFVLVTFFLAGAYVALLPYLGYRISTFLFVGGLEAVLERPRGRRWAFVLAVALGTTLATYYVFEGYLSVLLPRGRLTGF